MDGTQADERLNELRAQIVELRSDVSSLRSEARSDITSLSRELTVNNAAFHTELGRAYRTMFFWVIMVFYLLLAAEFVVAVCMAAARS